MYSDYSPTLCTLSYLSEVKNRIAGNFQGFRKFRGFISICKSFQNFSAWTDATKTKLHSRSFGRGTPPPPSVHSVDINIIHLMKWNGPSPLVFAYYSGTPLIQTPLGPKIIVLISGCRFFRGRIICNYAKFGLSRVSWLSKVSLFQRCSLREVPLYVLVITWPRVPVFGIWPRGAM